MKTREAENFCHYHGKGVQILCLINFQLKHFVMNNCEQQTRKTIYFISCTKKSQQQKNKDYYKTILNKTFFTYFSYSFFHSQKLTEALTRLQRWMGN